MIVALAPLPSVASVITFVSGNQTAQPANPVTVGITVNDFTAVFGFSFSLQWDPAVLQFNSVASFAALPGFSSANFNTTQTGSGRLGVLWDDTDFSGNDLANGSLLFNLNFTAVGAGGSSSTLVFGDSPTARDVVVTDGVNPIQGTFAGVNGGVSVVPEPVNGALAWFAALSLGLLLLRRIGERRGRVSPSFRRPHPPSLQPELPSTSDPVCS
jgi:hypothetical protein